MFTSRQTLIYTLLILSCLTGFLGHAGTVGAQQPGAVEAVMFWSQECEHCHKVLKEVLPDIQAKYGDQFKLSLVEITSIPGNDLWSAAWKAFDVPKERQGVPMLVVGDTVLVGDVEIRDLLPAQIDRGLAAGGLALPAALGLTTGAVATFEANSEALLTQQPEGAEGQDGTPVPPGTSAAGEAITSTEAVTEPAAAEAPLAPNEALANTLAWLVFAGMIATIAYALYALYRAYASPRSRPVASPPAKYGWLIPVLAVIGIVVAGYLSYVEITRATTFCPVGQCDKVQTSEYAKILGVPVAVLGLVSYVAMLLLWLWSKYGRGRSAVWAVAGVFALALFGTAFSVYLTAIELFVLDAVCMWCLISAVVVTLIAWFSLRPACVQVAGSRAKTARGPAGAPPGQKGAPRPKTSATKTTGTSTAKTTPSTKPASAGATKPRRKKPRK